MGYRVVDSRPWNGEGPLCGYSSIVGGFGLHASSWGGAWCNVIFPLLQYNDIDLELQDLHSANIVWNFHNTRIGKKAPDYKKFQRDFDFRLAFIDFGAAVRFPNGCTNHSIPCRPDVGPCAPYRSPEQDQEEGKTFDLFAADVYALAQILITEVSWILSSWMICWPSLQCKPTIDDANNSLPLEYSTLLEEMTALEPSSWPSAQAALTRLQAIMEMHM